jgi:propionyl-CoA synthetase
MQNLKHLSRCLGVLRRSRNFPAISAPRFFQTTPDEYAKLKRDSLHQTGTFWLDYANEKLDWDKAPTIALDSTNSPFYRWFPDGEINVCHQMLDRHVQAGHGDRVAVAYESVVGGKSRNITYNELLVEVENFAASLRIECGVGKGDRVLINMPMVPEALVVMLACTRVGAVHSVVFGGFAAPELAVRIDDAKPKAVVAASGGLEGMEKIVPYGPLVSSALNLAKHDVAHVIFKRRPEVEAKGNAPLPDVKDGVTKLHNWTEFTKKGSQRTKSEKACISCKTADPLYILYTSGTTGVPKGVLRDHTHPVALQWVMENFMKNKPGEVYWAASDIGWVVGHSFIVYGPLIHGCTTVLFEGKPVGTPDAATFWRVIEKHGVTNLFTAPTALRAIRKEDPNLLLPKNHDISTLRGIFLAGERADPGTIDAYAEKLGVNMIDNWWQTESGWPMTGMQFEHIGTKSGSCSLPNPGYDIRVLDAETHEEMKPGELGSIAIKLPFPPGTMQTLYNNDQRYVDAYLTEFGSKYYSAGDAGMIDEDGYLSVMARTDDVINTAGHRLSTGQMEEIISTHGSVAECAVVGVDDELKGQVPVGLVVLNAGEEGTEEEVVKGVIEKVRDTLGPVAAFKSCAIVDGLPKTRSGKILRGVIQKIANGQEYKLPGTIEDVKPVTMAKDALESLNYPQK